MTLKEAAQKLRELKPIMEMDLSGVPYTQRAQAEGAKRNAMREFREAGDTIRALVKENLVGLFIAGKPEETATFAKIAEEDAAAFTVDARELYRNLAQETLRGTTHLELGINEIAAMGRAIQAVAIQCGAQRLPMMQFGKLIHTRFKDMDEAVDFIYQQAVYPYLGDELNVIYLQSKLTEAVANVDYEQNTVPVIVLNATKQEIEGGLAALLFPGGNLAVDTEGSVDKDQVTRAFKKLKEVIKGKKPKKSKEKE